MKKTIDLTKYLPKSDRGTYLLLGILLFVVLFIISLFTVHDLVTGLIYSFGIAVVIMAWVIINDNLGEKRHKKILHSEAFTYLIHAGFKVEEVNRYSGLTGTYRNYIIDLHYNWAIHVNSSLVKAIVINVYFEPPLTDKQLVDEEKILQIAKRQAHSGKLLKRYEFLWRDRTLIMNHKIGYFNPSVSKLTKWMDIAVDTLISENLKPIDRKSLLRQRAAVPHYNVPEIDLYFPEDN